MVLTRQSFSASAEHSQADSNDVNSVLSGHSAWEKVVVGEPSCCNRCLRNSCSVVENVCASGTHNKSGEGKIIGFKDLPAEVTENVFGYLTFSNLGQIRLVCKQFDQIISRILSSTFLRLQSQMLQRFKEIKAQMPRRESARRKHHLAREADIIETLHMRLSLLQMSFGKHIERKHLCFFPGAILDEVYKILNYIKTTPNLGRAYQVTDELFDLSAMATEYFKEKIEPGLPEITCFNTDFLDFSATYSPGVSGSLAQNSFLNLETPSPPQSCSRYVLDENIDDKEQEIDSVPSSNMVLRKRIRRIRQGMKKYSTQLDDLKKELKACKGKVADQHKQILEYSSRLDEYDRKFEESSRKFSTLLQELNKCKTELQYWRSKSPANPPLCSNCGQSLSVNDDPNKDQELQALAHQGVIVGEMKFDLHLEKKTAILGVSQDGDKQSISSASNAKANCAKRYGSKRGSEHLNEDPHHGTKRKDECQDEWKTTNRHKNRKRLGN